MRQRVHIEGRQLEVSNLDKVLFPEVSFTKAQVIDYYVRIAPVLLPLVLSWAAFYEVDRALLAGGGTSEFASRREYLALHARHYLGLLLLPVLTLLAMHEDPEGQAVLRRFGVLRFVETTDRDYEPVYRYVRQLHLDLATYDPEK